MYNIDKKVLRDYRDYTYARSDTYYKKEVLKLPKPWTDHPQIQTFKFTNVVRKFDRESKFLTETVCNNPSLSLFNKAMNCIVFRMINNAEGISFLKEWPIDFEKLTVEDLLDWLEWEKAEEAKGAFKGKARQSNAYMLSALRVASYRLDERFRGYNTSIPRMVFEDSDIVAKALEEKDPKKVFNLLLSVKGLGTFLAYQVWADLTYIPEYPYTDNDLIICGPGAEEGACWLLGELSVIPTPNDPEVNEVIYNTKNRDNESFNEFVIWFQENLPRLMEEEGLEWNPKDFLHYLPEEEQVWSLQLIQNSFCELNKLMKLKNNCIMRIRSYSGV